MPEEHDLPPPMDEQEERLMDLSVPPDMPPSEVLRHDIEKYCDIVTIINCA